MNKYMISFVISICIVIATAIGVNINCFYNKNHSDKSNDCLSSMRIELSSSLNMSVIGLTEDEYNSINNHQNTTILCKDDYNIYRCEVRFEGGNRKFYFSSGSKEIQLKDYSNSTQEDSNINKNSEIETSENSTINTTN